MKHLYIFLLSLAALLPFGLRAQSTQSSHVGWPSNYGGVMLQSFAWNGYTYNNKSLWAGITNDADTLSKYFDLIWAPPSGYPNTTSGNMGYYPIYWLNQTSAFGTEQQLRTMITTFKNKGTGIIADVVINHKNGASSWTDFANETKTGTKTGKTYKVTWSNPLNDICSGDEANTASNSPVKGKITGSADTGENDGGCRDLDHTKTEVQNNIKTYLDFLKNEMGYTGFRYDMTKGYAGTYTRIYNEAANPTYSVGEYWDGNVSKVKSWIDATGKSSAAFDFPLKYLIKSSFSGSWQNLANYNSTSSSSSSLMGQQGYSQYAVTFVDNHDTGEPHESPDPQRANIAAANAFILAMPGTPCIWITHWNNYKVIIKKLILARKIAGVTNTSQILSCSAASAGARFTVKGTNGNVLLLLGSPRDQSASGYQLAVEGDNFKYYVSSGLNISSINNVKDDPVETHEIPSFCTVKTGETCAFFEVPEEWTSVSKINCWAWDAKGNYTGGTWPGVSCTLVGTHSNGNKVYKWTWSKSYKPNSGTGTGTTPTQIIFSAGTGSPQTNDMDFANGHYYSLNVDYTLQNQTAGISHITVDKKANTDNYWYTISGVRMSGKPAQKGIYIHDGEKVVVK